MSAENVSDIKLCPSKLAENYFGHILCRQKICLVHIGQITTLLIRVKYLSVNYGLSQSAVSMYDFSVGDK